MLLRLKPIVVVLASVGVAIAVLLAWYGALPKPWTESASILISVIALMISVLGFLVSDERARFTNSFDIAGKWDEEPMLSARAVFRQHNLNVGKLVELVHTPDVEATLVHYANFFWNMAVAIDTRWTDEQYLRLRFKESLGQMYPAIYALLYFRHHGNLKDSPSRNSLDRLCQRWQLPLVELTQNATGFISTVLSRDVQIQSIESQPPSPENRSTIQRSGDSPCSRTMATSLPSSRM